MSQLPEQSAPPPRGPPYPRPRRGRDLMIHEYVQAARDRLDAGNYSRDAAPAPVGYPHTPQSRNVYPRQVSSASTAAPAFPSRVPVRQAGNERLIPHPNFRHGTPRTRVLAVAESRYQHYASFAPQQNRSPASYPVRPTDFAPRPYPERVPPYPEQTPGSTPLDFSSHPALSAARESNPGAPETHVSRPNDQISIPSDTTPTQLASISSSTPSHSASRPSLNQVAQAPSVAVIPEEAGSHKSVGSSIASSGASAVLYEASERSRVYSGISDFLDGYGDRSTPEPAIESPGEEPVRQASIGQVQKPIVTHVSSTPRKDEKSEQPKHETVPTVVVEQVASPEHDLSDANDPSVMSPPQNIPEITIGNDRTLGPSELGQSESLESVSTISPDTSPDSTTAKLVARQSRSRSPLVPVESRFSQPLGNHGMLAADPVSPDARNSIRSSIRASMLFDRPRSKKLETLDVDALRDGEVRESMTSLRGLILRNLRLASNLERGVTSSRFGIDWIINAEDNTAKPQRASRSSMLNLFPSTPQGQSPGEEQGHWPLAAHTEAEEPRAVEPVQNSPPHRRAANRRKQCCGLPMAWFIVILIGLVILIVAAVVIPVALIVIPKQSNHHTRQSPTRGANSGTCLEKLDCGNRGSEVMSALSGACHCLCVDGWTGEKCTFHDTSGCVTSDVARATNVTAGSEIPALFKDSKAKFAIVLDPVTILGLFSTANMTCASENNLVSFAGQFARDRLPSIRPRAIAKAYIDVMMAPDAPLPGGLEARQGNVAMTNGIIYAQTTTSTPSVATPTTSTSPAYPTSFDPTSTRTLEFAQIAVLYIFQSTTKLSTAAKSRSLFESYFSAPDALDARALTLGDGWVANLVNGRVWYDGV